MKPLRLAIWRSVTHAVLKACRRFRDGWWNRFRRVEGRTSIEVATASACLRVDSTPAHSMADLPAPWPELAKRIPDEPEKIAMVLADQLRGRATASSIVVQGYRSADRLHLVSVSYRDRH